MADTENDFFTGKREWSKLKDEVLKKYLPPYLKKVNTLRKNIIIIDSFAGPGIYDDGEKGSPLFICEIANDCVPSNYLAILVNQNIEHHNSLIGTLKDTPYNYLPINGSSEDLLTKMHDILQDQTLFIYLDPFGLKGTKFSTIQKYLSRSKHYSTELVINLSIPTILRLSCVKAFSEKGETPEIKSKHEVLMNALGGDYWKEFLLDDSLSTEVRINRLISEYCNKIRQYLPYVGFCPVYEKTEISKLKYCIIFASRHPDAQILMNDIMFRAYNKRIWQNYVDGTLFSDSSWEEGLPCDYREKIRENILNILKNGKFTRKELWLGIISREFMRYQGKDFNSEINYLINNKIIKCEGTDLSKRPNDSTILYL
ncbi:MAG: hypothetical protein C0412_06980 [Flavobacterium sp.]|nr:hypothetical protein [Flavobacterium sp.]